MRPRGRKRRTETEDRISESRELYTTRYWDLGFFKSKRVFFLCLIRSCLEGEVREHFREAIGGQKEFPRRYESTFFRVLEIYESCGHRGLEREKEKKTGERPLLIKNSEGKEL